MTPIWRLGMWVTFAESATGILTKMGDPCDVDFVDPQTGITMATRQLPLAMLRQAKWSEIPAIRKQISKEKASELGYGS